MDLIAKAREMRAAGENVIGLGGGEPDFDTPLPIKEKAIEEILKGNTHYAVGKGLLSLRRKISQKLLIDNRISVDPDNIIITPGAKMAIYLAVRGCINSGDEVLIPTPSWVSYSEIVRASGGIPIEVPLLFEDNYVLLKKILEKYVTEKTRMIILCTPNNPTGRVLNQKEISELIQFNQKYGLVILSDEVYEKICYTKEFLSPGAYEELRDYTITVNGFSKAYAMTGWRLGYLAGPSKYIDAINKLYIHTITGTSPFIQEAALIALDCTNDVENMLQEYKKRRDYFIEALNSIRGVTVLNPEGAFYAWCKFDNEENVSKRLLEEAKVIGVPGEAYGSGLAGFVRFSFASSMEDLQEAIKRIDNMIKCTVYGGNNGEEIQYKYK